MNASAPSVTDLSNCDREPIHAPGSIQPHGFLFVVEPETWIVLGASANVRDFFWREASAVIGSKLGEVLDESVVPALAQIWPHPEIAKRALPLIEVRLENGDMVEDFTLVVHRSGDNLIVEGERSAGQAPLEMEQKLQAFLAHLNPTESLEELHRLAVTEVRRLTGFDRCLLYQFDADWNGAVIAEDRNAVLPSYLNQRFPASDIPQQARDLYRRNRVRLIPANNYRPSPVVTRSGGPSPAALDLSLSVLRSVSPIHLEYMRNMGTGSSMSVAILRGDALWGLISCHSLQPRWVPFATRAICDVLAQFLASQLATRENERALARRLELTGVVTRLLGAVAGAADLLKGARPEDLLQLADAAGVALVQGDRLVLHGQTPSATQVTALAHWVAEKDRPVSVWNELAADYAPAREFVPLASGLLAVSLETTPPSAVLWFRPEFIRVIEWGGEPRKAIEAHGEGRVLHPRKSFETWRETVHGHGRPWEAAVLSSASEFRQAVNDLLRRQPARKEPS